VEAPVLGAGNSGRSQQSSGVQRFRDEKLRRDVAVFRTFFKHFRVAAVTEKNLRGRWRV
jgi:hypothetical protein